MKDFIDYVSEIVNKGPIIKLKYTKDSIDFYIEKSYMDSIWKNLQYTIYRDGNIKYKLIGESHSFFSEDIIYYELLRYRFL